MLLSVIIACCVNTIMSEGLKFCHLLGTLGCVIVENAEKYYNGLTLFELFFCKVEGNRFAVDDKDAEFFVGS